MGEGDPARILKTFTKNIKVTFNIKILWINLCQYIFKLRWYEETIVEKYNSPKWT